MNFKGAWNNLCSNFALIPLGWGLIFKKLDSGWTRILPEIWWCWFRFCRCGHNASFLNQDRHSAAARRETAVSLPTPTSHPAWRRCICAKNRRHAHPHVRPRRRRVGGAACSPCLTAASLTLRPYGPKSELHYPHPPRTICAFLLPSVTKQETLF